MEGNKLCDDLDAKQSSEEWSQKRSPTLADVVHPVARSRPGVQVNKYQCNDLDDVQKHENDAENQQSCVTNVLTAKHETADCLSSATMQRKPCTSVAWAVTLWHPWLVVGGANFLAFALGLSF